MSGNAGLEIHVECSTLGEGPGLDSGLAELCFSFKFPNADWFADCVTVRGADGKNPKVGDTALEIANQIAARISSATNRPNPGISKGNANKIKISTKSVKVTQGSAGRKAGQSGPRGGGAGPGAGSGAGPGAGGGAGPGAGAGPSPGTGSGGTDTGPKAGEVKEFADQYARIDIEGVDEIDASSCNEKVDVAAYGGVALDPTDPKYVKVQPLNVGMFPKKAGESRPTKLNGCGIYKNITGQGNGNYKLEPFDPTGESEGWKPVEIPGLAPSQPDPTGPVVPPSPPSGSPPTPKPKKPPGMGIFRFRCGSYPGSADTVCIDVAWMAVWSSVGEQLAHIRDCAWSAGIDCMVYRNRVWFVAHRRSGLPVIGFEALARSVGGAFPWHWFWGLWANCREGLPSVVIPGVSDTEIVTRDVPIGDASSADALNTRELDQVAPVAPLGSLGGRAATARPLDPVSSFPVSSRSTAVFSPPASQFPRIVQSRPYRIPNGPPSSQTAISSPVVPQSVVSRSPVVYTPTRSSIGPYYGVIDPRNASSPGDPEA